MGANPRIPSEPQPDERVGRFRPSCLPACPSFGQRRRPAARAIGKPLATRRELCATGASQLPDGRRCARSGQWCTSTRWAPSVQAEVACLRRTLAGSHAAKFPGDNALHSPTSRAILVAIALRTSASLISLNFSKTKLPRSSSVGSYNPARATRRSASPGGSF